MARIPQYNRSVTPQNTAPGYVASHANPDVFGVNVARAGKNLGDAIGNVGNAIFELKEQYDRTKVIEVSNEIDKYVNDTMYDKDNGYLYKTGKDAMGKSPEIMEGYDKYTDELISKSGIQGYQAAQLRDIAAKRRIGLERYAEAHDKQQSDQWQDGVYTDALSNVFTKAINGRNNPLDIEKFRKDGYTLLNNHAVIKGYYNDPEMYAIKKKEYEGNFNAQVLNAYLADGSLKASDYFEKHKDEISPEKLPSYINFVKNNELTYTARQTAQTLVGLSSEEAFGSINKINDPETRSAVMREYSTLLSQQKAIAKEKNDKFMSELSQELQTALDNNENPNELKKKIMASDLSFEAKKQQIQYLNDCVELGQEVNLWNVKEYLDDLKVCDFETFQKLDLSCFPLTKAQRDEYLDAQRKVVDYSSEKQLREAVKEIDTRFNLGGGLDSNIYRDEFVGLLAMIERKQGKAFDLKNLDEGSIRRLIEGFEYKETVIPDELKSFKIQNFKNVDETKEVYMRAKGLAEIKGLVAKDYIKFKNQNKREPERQEIYGIVLDRYMEAARNNFLKNKAKIDVKINLQKEINNTSIKKSDIQKS